MKTTIINILGGAGVGKSTLASLLYVKMKISQNLKNVEIVGEFAKSLVYQKKLDKLKDQLYVTKRQIKLLKPYLNNVPIIVTDSPLILGKFYSNKTQKQKVKKLIKKTLKNVNEINIFIERNQDIDFETFGRIHSLEQSIKIDKKMKKMLQSKNYFVYKHGDNIDNLISKIEQSITTGEQK